MALVSTRVTVATTATLVSGTDSTDRWQEKLGIASSILVKVPTGGVEVFFGHATVTTANGYGVSAGESLALDLAPGDVLYAIVASGTQPVYVLQTGI